MIEIKNLTKTYITKERKVCALRGIDLCLPNKGMVFVLGKSGCGKSTLLNILGALDVPTSGQVLFCGQDVCKFRGKRLANYKRNHVGFVFQSHNLISEFSLEQNVVLPLLLQGEDSTFRAEQALKDLQIEDLAQRLPSKVSGGQSQRAAIARAIAKNCSMLLCDEPTGSLDECTAEVVFEELKKLSQDRLVVVVSHDEESAQKYADRIIKMDSGEIVEDSEPLQQNSNKQLGHKASKKKGAFFLRRGSSLALDRWIFLSVCIVMCVATFLLSSLALLPHFDNEYRKTAQLIVEQQTKTLDIAVPLRYQGKILYAPDELKGEHFAEIAEIFDMKTDDISWIVNAQSIGTPWEYSRGIESLHQYYDGAPFETITYTYAHTMVLSQKHQDDFGIIGRYPQADHEVAITNFSAEIFLQTGIYDQSTKMTTRFSDFEALLGAKVPSINIHSIGEQGDSNAYYHTIVGIVELDLSRYEHINGQWSISQEGALLLQELQLTELRRLPFVSQDYLANYRQHMGSLFEGYENGYYPIFATVDCPSDVKVLEQQLRKLDEQGYFVASKVLPTLMKIKQDDFVSDSDFANYPYLTMARYTPEFLLAQSTLMIVATILLTVCFAFLMVSNMLFAKKRRKSVGILKSLGVSGKDIIVLYGTESIFIWLVSCVLTVVLTLICVPLMTKSMQLRTGFGFEFFHYFPQANLLSIGIGLVLAGLCALIPLLVLMRAKPLKAIRQNLD